MQRRIRRDNPRGCPFAPSPRGLARRSRDWGSFSLSVCGRTQFAPTVSALPLSLRGFSISSGAQCTPLRSGVSPLVLCRIQPRSGGRGNPPLQGLCVAVRVVQNRTLLGRAMHAPTGLCVFVFYKTKSPDRQRNTVCQGESVFLLTE